MLAGGMSLRLGRDKALERIDDRSLLQAVIDALSSLGDEILLVVSSSEQLADFDTKGARKVTDSYPGRGALVGLYSGLKATGSSHSLVVGCDMPFLNVNLLRYITGLAPGFDVVIPRSGKQVEPLHAVYSKDCIGPIETCLSKGNCRVADVLPEVKVRYVEPDEIDKFDPQHLSFFNVNSEADLERARAIIERGNHDKR